MDPTESKPAGWYPSSRTPGMERYWNGDYWTSDYRPAPELQGQFGISSPDSDLTPPAAPSTEETQDVWSALDKSNSDSPEPILAPGVRTEYTVAPPGTVPPGAAYGAPYPGLPYGVMAPAQPQTMGIISLILAFFVPLAGVILGHITLSKAKKANAPHGVSLAAVIVGWICMAFSLLFWIPFLIVIFASASDSSSSSHSDASSNEVASYTVSHVAGDELEELYPGYDWWYVGCDEHLPLEEGASVTCEAAVYPFSDSSVSEEFTAEVRYLSGDRYDPNLSVSLDREPTPPEEFPYN